MNRETSNIESQEPIRCDNYQIESGKTDQNLEIESTPFAAATLLPVVPEIIVNDAEALHDPVVENVVIQVDSEHPESSTPGILNHLSTYITADIIASQSPQQEALNISHHLVQIDMVEDQGIGSAEEIDTPKIRDKRGNLCRVYLFAALFISFAGVVAMLIIDWKLEMKNDEGTVSPSPPTKVIPDSIPVQAPSTIKDTSAMPSCSGLYNPISSVSIKQSGSDLFTMDNEGRTIVVGNNDNEASVSSLETFYIHEEEVSNKQPPESTNGYSVQSMKISGDGSRLLLGLNSFPQDQISGLATDSIRNSSILTTGGALLQMKKDSNDHWMLAHKVLTGGGKLGGVFNVATSKKGTTVACSVLGEGDIWYVQVYRESSADESSNIFIIPLGARIVEIPIDRNSIVALSGNGKILFIATGDNYVRSFGYNPTDNDWVQFGEPMSYEIEPEIKPSYDGNVVALSNIFPVKIFERNYDYFKSASTNV